MPSARSSHRMGTIKGCCSMAEWFSCADDGDWAGSIVPLFLCVRKAGWNKRRVNMAWEGIHVQGCIRQ